MAEWVLQPVNGIAKCNYCNLTWKLDGKDHMTVIDPTTPYDISDWKSGRPVPIMDWLDEGVSVNGRACGACYLELNELTEEESKEYFDFHPM